MIKQSLINRIISHYRIIDLIGKGGMGTVYRGVHTMTGVEVAVKVLHQPGMGDRFINEAKLHARIKHPNIARMVGYDIIDSMPCIIMEYVDGPNLQDIMDREQKLPIDLSLKYFKQLCSAISYLHENDIIHRDIKPDNIKVMPDGVVKLLDFGIAKSAFSPKLTQEGFTIGTVDYMAPEHLNGHAEQASDVWSLGVILYRMLCGRMPFQANSIIEFKYKMESGRFDSPSKVLGTRTKIIDSIVADCLNKNPNQRPSCQELMESLEGEDGGISRTNIFDPKSFGIIINKLHAYGWVILSLIIVITISSIIISKKPSQKKDTPIQPESGLIDSVKINVLNTNNAKIVFPDESTYPIPYTIKGNRTEQATFTISAPGYEDMDVSLELNQRRKTFEYVLQKKDK